MAQPGHLADGVAAVIQGHHFKDHERLFYSGNGVNAGSRIFLLLVFRHKHDVDTSDHSWQANESRRTVRWYWSMGFEKGRRTELCHLAPALPANDLAIPLSC